MDWFQTLHPVVQALLGTLFTWAVTALGAGFCRWRCVFVVVEEVIPEAKRAGEHDMATMGAMAGFAVMMTLDVALG